MLEVCCIFAGDNELTSYGLLQLYYWVFCRLCSHASIVALLMKFCTLADEHGSMLNCPNQMHSISFGAEGDTSAEVFSVKILLKQAYSAHLAKVRSLENELKELREALLQINKRDKPECIRCKEVEETLDLCKQEYAAALDDQRKKFESLAQKVIFLENRNASVHGSSFAKQDAIHKKNELDLESSPEKQVLTSISTNINLPVVKYGNAYSDHSEAAKTNSIGSESIEADRGVVSCSPSLPKSQTDTTPVNQKDFFSTLQSSFLDYSTNDCDSVLVTETLDVLDEVPKTGTNENKTKKENSEPKGPVQSLKDADEGKENIFHGAKSEKKSGKRQVPSTSTENEQSVKKCKPAGSEDILNGNSKLCEEKVLVQVDPHTARSKDNNICTGKDNINTANQAENVSNFSVGSTFFNVDPSFFEQKSESVLNNTKKSKMQSPTKKSKAQNPTISITHDDDADFQTTVGSISKKGDESVAWKTSKKSLKKSANSSGVKTSARSKMTLEAPSLNFRKPKYKQTKLSKSVFQPSQTSPTDCITLSEKDDVHEDGSSRLKERDGNNGVKDKQAKVGTSNRIKDNSKSVKEGSGNNKVKEQSGNRVKENNDNSRESQKDLCNDSETVTWEGGSLFYSEMEMLEGGLFSSSEMEKLKNMTVDIDATFVPHYMLQNFNDSVPDSGGMSEGSMGQNDEPVITCDQDKSGSLNFVEDIYKRKEPHDESCTKQHTEYHIKQYPEKNLPKLPSSNTEKQKCNSFDRVPSPEVPNYKFKENTVRGKDKRQQLKGFDCKECEKYYSALGLSDEEKKERLKQCSRHRATHIPPATPANFWELDFPDTQECRERGYVGDTQKVALKSRRRRPLK